ncbi:MAG: carboxypeptidase-like regulatory domain-containing protein [Anaerolineales bacterium]
MTDIATGQPIANATVTCQHYSYTAPEADRCNRTTATDANGVFLFEKVFFHDTDTITLIVEAPGYEKMEVKSGGFTWNEWKVDITVKPVQ